MESILTVLSKILINENIALFISMIFNVFLGYLFNKKEKQMLDTLESIRRNNTSIESVIRIVDQLTDQVQILLVRGAS